MRCGIWLTGTGVRKWVPVYGQASRLRADPLQTFWIPPTRASLAKQHPNKIPTWNNKQPVWSRITPQLIPTVASYVDDDDRFKHDGPQPKRDGKWCCSTQRCWWDAPPFDNKNGTSTWLPKASRQNTLMNKISNAFYPTIIFFIRNWKTLKAMRGLKSLVRSTNVSVPWLAPTAVGNRTSLMQCCSSLANVHRSCD